MPLRLSLSRILCRAAVLAAALAFAPAAQAQCLPPGSEPYATQPVCNFEPMVTLTPATTSVSQPSVPVTFEAFDHYSSNAFGTLKVLLDGQDVTSQWAVTVAEEGTGTGTAKRFTSRGSVALTTAIPQRTLKVRLCDTQFCTEETSTFTLSLPGVEVTPDGTFGTEVMGLGRTRTFTVTNRGNQPASFALQASCRTGTTAQSCSASPAGPLQLAAGASQAVIVTYAAPTPGSVVRLALTATQTGTSGISDAGWTEVTVHGVAGTNAQAPTVALVELNSNAIVERSHCVTAAAGTGAAYECGDLRLAHALPAHRTMGRTWSPVLLYNSQHAQPRPVVYYDVTLPVGAKVPMDFKAVLYLNETGRTVEKVFPGSEWAPGTTRRIAIEVDGLSHGVHFYYFQVLAREPNSQISSPVSTGVIPVVDRSASPFGAGWWLAGAESLCAPCVTGTAGIMWTGGDGSVRLYQLLPGWSNRWTATMPDGPPDTLTLTGTTYTRRLRGGGRVEFNSAGQHLRTVNRLGQETRFQWDGNGVLDTVTVPVPAGGGAAPRYVFAKDNQSGPLTRIRAEAPGAATRIVALGYGYGDRRLTAIYDPDERRVELAYGDPARPRAVTSRTDRRGTITRFGYGAHGRLTSARLLLSASDSIVTAYDPVEAKGLGTSVALAQAYTRLDGPRTDVADHTYLWPSRNGLPARVRDALGAETVVEYDAIFPALATRVTSPTGQVALAHYDAGGRVDTMTVVSPLGDGRNHATTITYDNRWDAPTSTTSYEVSTTGAWTPVAGTAYTAYDEQTGNVLWQQVGGDVARRVTFGYYTSGQLAAVRYPHPSTGVAEGGGVDSLYYDARGNLRMTRSPLGFRTLHVRDVLGRDSIVYTPIRDAATARDPAQLQLYGARQITLYDVLDRPWRTESVGPALTHTSTSSYAPPASPQETVVVTTTYDEGGLPRVVDRWSSPDPGSIGVLRTEYTYDRAGRMVTESSPGNGTRDWEYDRAGNVTLERTPLGHAIQMQYDALGRLVRRVVPGVMHGKTCGQLYLNPASCEPFPHFPTAGTSYHVPEEWSVFRYDRAGNLVYAENGDAIVQRTYTPGGWLATDTLRIRTYGGVDFQTHVYGLQYGYGVSGRPTSLVHPQNLAGSASTDSYGYDPVTGALTDLGDRRGNYFHFRYDLAGRMRATTLPGLGVDSMAYDLEGRLVWRRDALADGTVLQLETMQYDARGKILLANNTQSEFRQWYSGLGLLAANDWTNLGQNLARVTDQVQSDPLGNTVHRRTSYGQTTAAPEGLPEFRTDYEPGSSRVVGIHKLLPAQMNSGSAPDSTTYTYDIEGNQVQSRQRRYERSQAGDGTFGTALLNNEIETRSFYGADGRLRAIQKLDVRRASSQFGSVMYRSAGVWEEYRYDPLGRRVLVRTRGDGGMCDVDAWTCTSSITRSVWEGDNLLWELKAPGAQGQNLEATSGSGAAYGQVSYTHAGGIDRPLVITKGSTSIVTHQNWRGMFSLGTYGVGTTQGRRSDCPPGVTTGCTPIMWPGERTTARHELSKDSRIQNWFGGLVDGMRDASGQMYMRNRYYDPQSGQFTQPDPIGLAGGLNAYGFAAGDPVSFSDPYGLSAENCCDWLTRKWTAWNAYLDRQEQRAIEDLSRLTGGDQESARRLYDFGSGAGMMSAGTVRSGGEVLSRLGRSRESAARLGRKAAEAEEGIGIHGVSVTAGTPRGPASGAAREVVEREFPVHNTPTRADPLHRTVELPKPVTTNVAELFNNVFGRQ